jgi:hypothetical protein
VAAWVGGIIVVAARANPAAAVRPTFLSSRAQVVDAADPRMVRNVLPYRCGPSVAGPIVRSRDDMRGLHRFADVGDPSGHPVAAVTACVPA